MLLFFRFDESVNKRSVSALIPRRFPRLRIVVALAINRRHFRPHAAQIRRKLPTVVNRVVQPQHHKRHRRPLEHPAKNHDLHQLRAREFCQRLAILRMPLLIPRRDLRRGFHAFRKQRRVGVEHAVDHRLQKAVVRRRYVSYQFHRASRVRIRLVVALVRRNRLQDFPGNPPLVLQRSQIHVLQQNHRLFRSHRLHFIFLLCGLPLLRAASTRLSGECSPCTCSRGSCKSAGASSQRTSGRKSVCGCFSRGRTCCRGAFYYSSWHGSLRFKVSTRAFAGFQEVAPSIVHARSHRPPSAPSLPDSRWSSPRKHRTLPETVSAIQGQVPFTLQKLHHFLRPRRL